MNLKIAIFSAGLLCIGCAAPEKYTQQTQTSVKQVQKEAATTSEQDRTFVQLLSQHQTIGAQLAEQGSTDAGAAPIREMALKLSKESTYELERLQSLSRTTGQELTRAERPSEASNSQASDRQHVSGVANNNESLPNEQSARENHSGVAVPETAGVNSQVGPTTIATGSQPFHERWITTMTQHQQAGIQLLQSYQNQLKNEDLRKYAGELLQEKQQTLTELQNFRPQVGVED